MALHMFALEKPKTVKTVPWAMIKQGHIYFLHADLLLAILVKNLNHGSSPDMTFKNGQKCNTLNLDFKKYLEYLSHLSDLYDTHHLINGDTVCPTKHDNQ